MVNITLNDSEIKSKKIKDMLKNMPQEELKKLFLNFLEKKFNSKQNRWKDFTNSIEELNITNISHNINKASKELRDNFSLRDVDE